jgi:hypothetical protein
LITGHQFKGKVTNSHRDNVEVNTPVVIFNQSGSTVIFSPTLELYGYGLNLDEAKASLENNLLEFVAYTMRKGTFFA